MSSRAGSAGGSGTPRHVAVLVALGLVIGAGATVVDGSPAGADGTVSVSTGAQFVAAVEDPATATIVLSHELTLGSEPLRPAGADPLEVVGNHYRLRPAPGTAVLAAAGPTGDLTVHDIAVTGAGDSAIRWNGGRVTVDGSSLTFNVTTGSGGAISAAGAPIVVVTHSDISGNFAAGAGGGIWTTGDVEVVTTDLDDNTAGAGGGVSNAGGTGVVTVERSGVVGNEATTGDGGGIWSATTASSSVSFFQQNIAADRGGAVWAAGGFDATASYFADGRARSGGAVASDTSISLTNSTVDSNQASVAGGGIAGGDVTLTYATVNANSAPTGANVATASAGTLTIFGTILSGPAGGTSCSGFTADVSLGWSAESSSDSCGLHQSTDRANAPDPLLGPTVLVGHAEGREPLPGSFLIDAIDPAGCAAAPNGVNVDQLGTHRPVGPGCDIGAVEAALTNITTTSEPNGTTTVVGTTPGGPPAPPATPTNGSAAYTG